MNLNYKFVDNPQEWESLVLKASDYTFLNSWQFGELHKKLGKNVVRVVVKLNGKSLIVYQAIIVNAKRGKVMHLRHAPIFMPDYFKLPEHKKSHVLTLVLQEIKNWAAAENCDFIRIQPLIPLESDLEKTYKQELEVHSFVPAQIHNIDAQKTLKLDITREPDEIMDNMRKQTRYYIRRAERDGVEVVRSSDVSDIEKFFSIHHETTIRQEFTSYPLSYYQKYFESMNSIPQSKLSSEIFFAEYEGKRIAAAIIIFFGDNAAYSDGGSLSKYSKIPASYRIQWEAILRAKKLGCKNYNFWGGVSPDQENKNYPWYGIDMFKRGFGGKRFDYVHAYDYGLSWKYRFTRVWEWFERKRRGY